MTVEYSLISNGVNVIDHSDLRVIESVLRRLIQEDPDRVYQIAITHNQPTKIS